MKSKAGPAYRVLETLDDYNKFLAYDGHSVVGMSFKRLQLNKSSKLFLGYFDSETNSLKDDLVKVAGQLSEKFRFAYTTAKDVLAKAGQTK